MDDDEYKNVRLKILNIMLGDDECARLEAELKDMNEDEGAEEPEPVPEQPKADTKKKAEPSPEKPKKKIDPAIIKEKAELLDLRYKEWLGLAQYLNQYPILKNERKEFLTGLLVHLKDAQVVLKALQEGKNQDIEEWMKVKLPKITKEHVLGFSTKQRLARIEELTGEFKEIGDTL